jgi:uncharacterized protein (UPF0147 family)
VFSLVRFFVSKNLFHKMEYEYEEVIPQEKKGPNLLAKRKIDYVLEEKEKDPNCPLYVRKWLSHPFVKEIR